MQFPLGEDPSDERERPRGESPGEFPAPERRSPSAEWKAQAVLDGALLSAPLFHNMPLGLAIWHLEALQDPLTFRLIALNPAGERVFGVPGEEIIGKLWEEIFPASRGMELLELCAQVVRSGQAHKLEGFRYGYERVPEGIYSLQIFPLPDRCVGLIWENLSGPPGAETEKLASLGQMAAQMVHEIKNPLAGLKNSFLLIKDAIPQDHPHFAYVGRIEKELTRLTSIVHQMLEPYLLPRQTPQEFNLAETIHEVIVLLETNCRRHRVTIQVEVPEEPLVLFLPESLVRQVLFNLFLNGLEASPPGEAVRVVAEAREKQLILTVSDRGPGIPEEVRSQIFEPFFSTKKNREKPGLGLGLTVCRDLVKAMQGELDFESHAGGGTTFQVRLPLTGASGEVSYDR